MDDRPEHLRVTDEDWKNTPPSVQVLVASLAKRVEEFEARINRNSSNSNQPPSSDGPFKDRSKQKQKRGGQKGHEGHQQTLLDFTDEEHIYTSQCPCGGTDLIDKGPYYIHQEIELPDIQMTVNPFLLHEQQCQRCSQTLRAQIPLPRSKERDMVPG